MKRILYIATSNIFKKTGGGIANRALLKALVEKYPEKVDVIHMEIGGQNENSVNFYYVPELSTCKKILYLLKGQIHRYYHWMLDFLDSHPDQYSHCFINCGDLGDLVEEIQRRGIKVAVIHHNYEVEFQMDNRSPSTIWGISPFLVRRNEKKAYKYADLNLFLTESDKNRFIQEYGEARCRDNKVIGIFEPEERTAIASPDIQMLAANKLVICGSLNSVQTLKGIKNFAKYYLNNLYEYYNNEFLLTLTGRSPGKYIQKLALKDNLKLVPSPENISSVVGESGIFICPTNVGGGIKLRIMDGLKLGLPILTHKVSARGYDCFFDKPWFRIYQDRESFVDGLDAINKLIKEQPQLRALIIKSYNEHFSYGAGKERFLEMINAFMSDK